jgi:hypothetical protein
MKTLNTMLLAGLLIVLSVIALELHSIRMFLSPRATLGWSLQTLVLPRTETHEQRDERLRRTMQEMEHDGNVMLGVADAERGQSTTRANPKTPRPAEPPRR